MNPETIYIEGYRDGYADGLKDCTKIIKHALEDTEPIESQDEFLESLPESHGGSC